MPNQPIPSTGLDIAIIAINGRFPKANSVAEFWENLQNGVESISQVSEQDLLLSGVASNLFNDPNYVKAASTLNDFDLFDANFFGINPREAEYMDPQNRLFLECAWESLEIAGYDPERYAGLIGVYAGSSENTYLINHLAQIGKAQITDGGCRGFLATGTSYKLNLKGPSLYIQTFCSTSMVAIHLACQSLLNEECDMALAGGVSVRIPHHIGYLYGEGGITSPDGHCRAFDADAQGTIFGSGVGIVVLKRLEDAIADHDHIEAVIKGSAINNDGSLKVSFAAPSVDGQSEAIAEALAIADINPETITYVESHGTGTNMGDPVEIMALTQAFRSYTQKRGFCAIGSLKSNIGHLDAAAGVASLIKTVLALKHRKIPPTLHVKTPNPKIDFPNTPFYVNTDLKDWITPHGIPRRAGVSSLGVGGTNAHVIVEESPQIDRIEQIERSSRSHQLLLLSAKSLAALDRATQNLAKHLQDCPSLDLADVAYTLQVGRRTFGYRRMLVCQSAVAAAKDLAASDPSPTLTQFQDSQDRPIIFMFSGQGSQYVNMGKELYQEEAVFRQHIDYCASYLYKSLGLDLRDVLYPTESNRAIAEQQLKQTAIAQPAIFTIAYAIAQLWMHWGIKPHAMIGHSIGEYVAACLAGVFSLDEALALVAQRGRLMQQQPIGAMVAISRSPEEIKSFLNADISLAAINSPTNCVVSGTTEAISALIAILTEREIEHRPLHTSHAFHSAMMEPVVSPLVTAFSQVRLQAPKTPYVSNVTGKWITDLEATSASYWGQHLRQAVRFSEGMQQLLEDPYAIFLEVGAGNTLSSLAMRHPERKNEHIVLTSLPHPKDHQSDAGFLIKTLGQLWLAGTTIDWENFYADEERYRVALTTYPFERQRFWIDGAKVLPQDNLIQNLRQSLTKNPDQTQWFYMPLWKQTVFPALEEMRIEADSQNSLKPCWLIFADSFGLSTKLAALLQQSDRGEIITVNIGNQFGKVAENSYVLNPQNLQDYGTLLNTLQAIGKQPTKILHLWNVLENTQESNSVNAEFAQAQSIGFYSLIFIAQALDKCQILDPIEIIVVSNNLHSVLGNETIYPARATLLAPCKTIPQEYPHIRCRNIDVTVTESAPWQSDRLLSQLLREITSTNHDAIVAYRNYHRWTQSYEPIPISQSQQVVPIRQKGVYLITGGLGRIGLVLAEYLARNFQAKLILIGRSPFPERQEWERWLTTHTQEDPISQKIEKLHQLENLGSEVLVMSVDITDKSQMQAALIEAESKLGNINGVIHGAGALQSAKFSQISAIETLDCEQQFQPKVYGLLVLEELLGDRHLDFWILMSSLAAILGGLGMTAYAAANLFMDSFVITQNDQQWRSLNWDSWNIEEAKNAETSKGSSLLEFSMTAAEGAQAFEQALAMTFMPQIAIAVADLPSRYEQWIQSKALQLADSVSKPVEETSDTVLYTRPNLPTAYAMPNTQVEQTISTIWEELLGIKQIGIHDNFFSLGGDSFLLIQAKQKLQTALSRSIPTVDLFEYPTINSLATYLSQADANQASTNQVSSTKTEKAPMKNISDRASKQRAAMEQEANQRLSQRRSRDNG
ncbi:type I polyketide synthase [Pseudanabaena sp. ABRG5-3]|uniref:type I polyketide synthase n=1 Tax=Pseudanabaena sp. ABRG5-3 TaxID=685565 RepID=UPI000DC6EDEF|nr:type I polyketide synthase [Pseudanabaena sp. ABRG5-3]BBC27205.1 6-deoxyerythronolide-B synthase [Pseudanabaena sp. ABRG5-3]